MSRSRVGKKTIVPRKADADQRHSAKFEPIEYVNLTDRVYRAIKARILSQEIEVGSRLRDAELAEQLGVSRTPVREASMRLAQEGLVDIVPRSGTRVRIFSEREIEDIWDLRVALEAMAVRKAVVNISSEQLRYLQLMHERSEVGIRADDTRFALEFDEALHRVILEASGNHRLQQIMATINDLVELFRNIGARTPFHRGYTYRHQEILRALAERNPDAAAQTLAEHLEMSKKELLRDVHQRELLTTTNAGRQSGLSRRRRSDRPIAGKRVSVR
jgi:DNA-binding GntR family transcriptional regulator